MSTDFSEKERAFVGALAAETGRDLAAWMAAIAARQQHNRNDVIDWLRQEGFTFSRASWLERIFHNGGKLIYGGAPRGQLAHTAPAKPLLPALPTPQAARAPPSRHRSAELSADADVDELLARAKAYRPLAQVVLREVLAIVPGADVETRDGLIVIRHSQPFAAIAATPREVRLALALPPAERAADAWTKSKFPTAAVANLSGLTHMIALTDVRQLGPDLRLRIVASAQIAAA